MKENKPSLYTAVYTKETLPNMCKTCVQYGDHVCEACLKEYNEKRKENDRTSNN